MTRVRQRVPVRAGTFACTLFWCLPVAAQDEPIVHADARAELRYHAGGQAAELAARLADQAWAAVTQALDQVRKFGQLPDEAIAVDVYATDAGFATVRARNPLPFDAHAFALRDHRRACVQVAPPLEPEVLQLVGLPPTTRIALVRQVAWLCASRSEVGHDDPWLCQVFAEGVLDAIDNPKFTFGTDPLFDARRSFYPGVARRGERADLAQWIDWVGVPEDRPTWEASREMAAWCAQLLAQKSSSWPKKLLQKPRRLAGSNGVLKIRRGALEAVLGRRWPRIEEDFAERLREVELGWMAALPVVAPRDGRFLMSGGEEAARLARVGTLPDGPFAVQVRVQMLELGDELWRLHFYHDNRTFAVFVESDRVHVSTFDGEHWNMLESARFDRDRYDPLELRVEVRGNVTVFVDGVQELEVSCAGFEMRDEVAVAVHGGACWVDPPRLQKLKN